MWLIPHGSKGDAAFSVGLKFCGTHSCVATPLCLQTCITLTLKSTHTNTPKHTQRWGHWNLTNKNILSPQKYSSKWEDRKFQTKLWDTLDLFGNAMYIRMIFTSKILALNFSCPMHLSSRSQFSKHFMGKEWDCRSGWLGGYT